jgi:hypothetical protein
VKNDQLYGLFDIGIVKRNDTTGDVGALRRT